MASKNRAGEIVLLRFPYTEGQGAKTRPAVIITDHSATGLGSDMTVAYMTTEVAKYASWPNTVRLDGNDLSSGQLKKQSIIRTDKLITVDQSIVSKSHVAQLAASKLKEVLKASASELFRTYYQSIHYLEQNAPFEPGKSRVNYAGRVFDEHEMANLADSALDFWLTSGTYSKKFETALADNLGVKYAYLVNSGSSANLLAFKALTSPKLGEQAIRRGDEVISVAAGFPTTIAPIIQFGAVPVFVDVDLATANVDPSQLEAALSKRTKAVMLAHSLGNPFDLRRVKQFCQRHGLWLVEDNCDALGSMYLQETMWPDGEQAVAGKSVSEFPQPTGTFGHIGTSSFYPPHHLTMGEGGAVYTNNSTLARILLSLRDWGRDCWCPSGKDNTCGKRFAQQHGTLPFGFDHKYVYSHFGYNLKPTDLQAAIGCAQLEKLDDFTAIRRANFNALYQGLQDLESYFILPQPEADSLPSWFGFLFTIRNNAPFTRGAIVDFLEKRNIQTRNLFAGNITRHPCFMELEKERDFRVIGNLVATDKIMNDSFWIGVYPGMGQEEIAYMIQTIRQYVGQYAD